MPPIFLVGYRGTGKSSVGRLVAERLGIPFADTDVVVEQFTGGASFSDYFAARGEEAFRDLENGALRRILADRPPAGGPVVATGGGIIVRAANVVAMREAGPVVWLTASADTIRARLAADALTPKSRPPLAGRSALAEVSEVLSRREPLYRAAAHAEVSTEDRDPAAVAQSVLEFLSSWPLGGPRE